MPPGAPQEALRGPLGSLGTLAWGSRGPGSFPSRPRGPPDLWGPGPRPRVPTGAAGVSEALELPGALTALRWD